MDLWAYISFFLIFLTLILAYRIKKLSDQIKSIRNSNKSTENTLSSQSLPFSASPQENTAYFEAILKSISDGLLIIDQKGIIVLSNQSFREILKIDEHPEGKQFMEVIRNMDLLNLIRSAMFSREEVTQEITIKKGGKDIEIIAKATPAINFQGSVSSIIILLHDITRLKHLESIRKDFVANVSHELKTPLTAIKGYAETLLDGALNDKENSLKFIEIIKNQADRLTTLVEDLLTLSRIEFGEIKVDKKSLNLDQIIDSTFQILNEKAIKKGLYIKKDIPSDTTVYADRDRLMQILINLVDNAIKFTDTGGVTIKNYKENGKFVLSVEDTGIGIPKAHLQRIGERFYRVDKARSRQLGGTGLGLAIVKHLVRAHGWDLKIESESGKGTKVKIIIPSENQDISQ